MGARNVAALLLATLAALAGCVTPASTTPAAVDDIELGGATQNGLFHALDGVGIAPPADAVAALGGGFLTGFSATEPTIGRTSDGSLFMTAMMPIEGAGRNAPTIVRSDDGGLTWTDVGPKVPGIGLPVPPITNDPYVYVDPLTDRVYDLDLVGTACSVLSWTDDKGASWTTNPLACGTPGGNDHQTMVTATPRMLPTTLYENVVYYCVNRVAAAECATSLDGGLTFTPLHPVQVGVDPARADPSGEQIPLCGATTGHLKSGPDGKVYLPKAQCSIQPGPASVFVTEDDGITWRESVIDTAFPVEGHEVAVAIDEENNVYASWQSGGLHYFAASTDGANTWTPARLLTPPGVTATEFNAIAAGKAGHVAIAYIGSTIEGGYEGKGTGNAGLAGDILGQPELPEWDNATWNGYITIITDATSAEATLQTVTVNDPADPLARGLCGHTRCNGMNDFIDMVIDHEGRPWVAFVDVCHAECVAAEKPMSDGAIGLAGTLLAGPALRGDARELPVLSAQAPQSSDAATG